MLGPLGFGWLVLAWLLAPPAAAQGQPETAPTLGEVRGFGDWIVGCDNIRRCTALGLPPEDGGGGYVAIRRGGAGDAAPRVLLSAIADGAADDPSLAAAITGRGGRLLAASYPAEADGGYLTAAIEGAETAGLIEALRRGDHLDLTPTVSGVAAEPQRVSLAGSAAALLDMDERQQRAGTVTALARPGDAPADAVPPAPEPPAVPQLPMKALPSPMTAPPAGIAVSGDASCAGIDPIAIALTDGSTLWGLCDFAAAYNTDYRFWIVGSSGTRPASFDVPGRSDDDPAVLTNPDLAADGLAIGALALGRGLGDCGTLSGWAWTGRGFALLQYSEMETCRGVPPDDWPRLFRASE